MASMTVPETMDLSDYSSRILTIEVVGGCHQERMRTATYKITVPYRRLSRTIQNIHRLGGKIAQVTLSSSREDLGREFVRPLSEIAKSTIPCSLKEAESAQFSQRAVPALAQTEPPAELSSSQPRRSKTAAPAQQSAKTKSKQAAKPKDTQGQRSKRKKG